MSLLSTVPFRPDDSQLRETFFRVTLPERLSTLTPDRRPEWGGLTPQQTVEHLLWAFEVSTGKVLVECHVPEARQLELRAFLSSPRQMPRSFANPALASGLPSFPFSGISAAVTALNAEVVHFLELALTRPGSVQTHPVFGPLDKEDWSRLHFKHCFHHLLQFALVTAPPPEA